jgi:hypothetical protein
MFNHHLIKRSLAGGLVIAAAGFPPAAHAMFIGGGDAKIPVPPPASAPPVSQRLDQLQRNVNEWFAVHGGFPASVDSTHPASTVPAATPSKGFQWGDAGIGAAGASLLLGTGALGVAMTRRRRHVAVS